MFKKLGLHWKMVLLIAASAQSLIGMAQELRAFVASCREKQTRIRADE